MNTTQLLLEPTAQRVGWTLLHFVWQGLVLGALQAMAMQMLRLHSAQARYAAACAALALMATAPVLTFALLPTQRDERLAAVQVQTVAKYMPVPSAQSSVPLDHQATHAKTSVSQSQNRLDAPTAVSIREPWFARLSLRVAALAEPALPWVVALWMAGVFLFSVWYMGGWLLIHRLRGSAQSFDDDQDIAWQAAARRIADQLGIRRPVTLMKSLSLAGPLAVGVLKPLILMPVSVLCGLTQRQIEAILAHELAHIRRWDYLVNLLQTVVETLLFYHPAIWWVSRRIRVERENCCDDLAAHACGDAVLYAGALTALAKLVQPSPRLAVAAGSSLLGRVQRLLKPAAGRATRFPPWSAGLLTLIIVGGLAVGLRVHALAQLGEKRASTANRSSLFEDGIQRVVLLPQSWGQVSDGLQSRLTLDCPRLRAGERIYGYLDVRNVSDKPIELVWTGNLGPLLKVNRDGRIVPRSSTRDAGIYDESKYLLQPGKQVEAWTELLSDEFDLSQPGEYSFQWSKVATEGRLPPPSNVVTLKLLAADAAKQPKWLGGEWSESSGGLQTRLAVPDGAPFRAGKPIPMRIELRNVGDKPVRYHDARGYRGGAIKVADHNGNNLPFLVGPGSTQSHGPVLNPGEQVVLGGAFGLAEFDLAEYYYLRKPGSYTVRYEGGDRYGDKDPPTPPSPPLKIEVMDDPAAQSDGDAVGKLLAGLPKDWSLRCSATIGTDLDRPGANLCRVRAGEAQLLHKRFSTKDLAGQEQVLPVTVWIACEQARPEPWQGNAGTELDETQDPRRVLSHYLGSNRYYHVYATTPKSAVNVWPTLLGDLRKMLQVSSAPPATQPEADAKADIHTKAAAGDVAAVKSLLAARPTLVRLRDENGWTPLHVAATRPRNNAMAALLLDNGADVNARDERGRTALHLALAYEGDAGMVRLLLERGVNVNVQEHDIGPPIIGWDKRQGRDRGETALHLAVQRGSDDAEIVRMLLAKGANPNTRDLQGYAPLHLAARNGKKDVARLLIENGADVKAAAGGLGTPLHFAAYSGNLELVKLLLARGAPVNAKESNGMIPLHWAARSGHVDVAELLLSKGSELDAPGEVGRTALHEAAVDTRTKMLELLLARKARANPKDNEGMTPLHWAADRGKPEIVRPLLLAGADVAAQDGKGRTPLGIARDRGHQEVVDLLEAAPPATQPGDTRPAKKPQAKLQITIDADGATFQTGKVVTIMFTIKNLTAADLEAPATVWSSRVILDGKEYKRLPKCCEAWNGAAFIIPLGAIRSGLNLSYYGISEKELSPGEHKVSVKIGDDQSNELTIKIPSVTGSATPPGTQPGKADPGAGSEAGRAKPLVDRPGVEAGTWSAWTEDNNGLQFRIKLLEKAIHRAALNMEIEIRNVSQKELAVVNPAKAPPDQAQLIYSPFVVQYGAVFRLRGNEGVLVAKPEWFTVLKPGESLRGQQTVSCFLPRGRYQVCLEVKSGWSGSNDRQSWSKEQYDLFNRIAWRREKWDGIGPIWVVEPEETGEDLRRLNPEPKLIGFYSQPKDEAGVTSERATVLKESANDRRPLVHTAEPPLSQPSALGSLPAAIKIEYFGQRGRNLTVTEPAVRRRIMEWLQIAESGPVSEHAKLGKCEPEAVIRIFDNVNDAEPRRTIQLYISCHHAMGRLVTEEQYKELETMVGKPAATSSAAPPATQPENKELKRLPGAGTSLDEAVAQASLVLRAKAVSKPDIFKRQTMTWSGSSGAGEGHDIGGVKSYAKCRQTFRIIEALKGASEMVEKEIEYTFLEDVEGTRIGPNESPIPADAAIILFLSKEGRLVKAVADTAENVKAVIKVLPKGSTGSGPATSAAGTDRHTLAEIRERHLAAGDDGKTSYLAIYAPREEVPMATVGTNKQEIEAILGPPCPVSKVLVRGGIHEEMYDTFDARWFVSYSNDGRPRKIEREVIVKDAQANRAGAAREIIGLATREHTREEILARHVAAGENGKRYGAVYTDWEIVPVPNIGTNHTSIEAKLGPPYQVSDRYVPKGGTYQEIHDTYDARWQVTYLEDGRPLKIERALILKDAGADKAAVAEASNAAQAQEYSVKGIQWINLKAGKITLGPPDAPRTAELKHDITISAGPITCEQYVRFLAATNRKPPVIPPGDPTLAKLADLFTWEEGRPPKSHEDWPVALVAQDDAKAYCQWLSQATGRAYRLPTKDELTYAHGDAWYKDRGVNWLDSIAWWGLGPVGGPSKVLSQVGLQCFPLALDEWTSENWLVSGGGGHRPEAGAAATHFYAMQGPGQRLEVYGFRVVKDSDVGAKETANQPATSPARTPAAGKLEFRVAPYHPSKVKNPTVNESNVKYYLELLKGGEIEKTPAHWFLPIHGEAKGYDDLITAEHEGRTYLLVCHVPGQTMRAEENGKDAWGLESAYKTKDENGKWTIGFRFDGNGSRRFGELTKANAGSALAIVIGGEVMAAPIIRVPSVECPVITGRFSDEEARDLVTALKAAMPPTTSPTNPSATVHSYADLVKLHDSPAYRKNLDWHRNGGKSEVRISWFLDDRPSVAILCAIEWSQPGQGAMVVNRREIQGWPEVAPKGHLIIPAETAEVRRICEDMPRGIPVRSLANVLIFSVPRAGDRAFHLYDRKDLPKATVRLCELLDAYVEAGPDGTPLGPQKAWKRKFGKTDSYVARDCRITLGLTKEEVRREMTKGRRKDMMKWYDFEKVAENAFAGDIWLLSYGPEEPGLGQVDEVMLTFQDGKVVRIEKRSFANP